MLTTFFIIFILTLFIYIQKLIIHHKIKGSISIYFNGLAFFNSKFSPKYTFLTISSSANSCGVPSFKIPPSNTCFRHKFLTKKVRFCK